MLANFAGQNGDVIHIFVQLQDKYDAFYAIQTDVDNNSPPLYGFDNSPALQYNIVASCTSYSFGTLSSALAIEINGQFKVMLVGKQFKSR